MGAEERAPCAPQAPLLVFTDLDGTLLDHHGYGWQGAAAALAALKERGAPLVFVSSKTRAELLPLQEQMGLAGLPLVAENGGVVFVPPAWRDPLEAAGGQIASSPAGVVCLGAPYARVRQVFARLRQGYGAVGFGDMEAAEIAARTGLDLRSAARAKERECSEPFVCHADVAVLKKAVASAGMTVTCGGRFFHLLAAGQDKGKAVRFLATLYAQMRKQPVLTIGLGDAPNDLPLLRAVDIPVVVPRPDGSRLAWPEGRPRIAPLAGSQGWGEAMIRLLAELDGQP